MSRATIHDVARLAGVARTTVSRVLNDTGYVSDASRRKVEDVIRQLDYRPSVSAASLRSRSVRTVGVIVDDLADAYSARVIRGIVAEADSRGVMVAVTMLAPETVTARAGTPLGRWDGDIVVGGAGRSSPGVLTRVGGSPTVVIGHAMTGTRAASVLIDPSPSAHDLALRVARRGHRRAVVVRSAVGSWVHEEFARAVYAGLLRAGFAGEDIEIATTQPTVAGGRAAAAHILQRPSGLPSAPTVLLCADDAIARGVIALCHERGLGIPTDIAVTGFGDSIESRVVTPALTTIELPAERLGRLALDALLTRIDSPSASASVRTVPATIVERASLNAPGLPPGPKNGEK